MRQLRVILILHTLQRGGAPKLALDAFEHLSDRVSVKILALEDGPYHDRCKDMGGAEILPPPNWSRAINKRIQWRIHKQLLTSSLLRWKPDIVYVNSVAALPFAWHVSMKNIPVILQVNELGNHLQFWADECPNLLKKWPDKYIAVSNAVRNALINDYGIAWDKTLVVNAFMDDATLASSKTCRKSLNAKPFIVGGAGFVGWCKGFVLWLQMARYLVDMLGADNIRFVWVGVRNSDDASKLKIMTEKLKISKSIEFVQETSQPASFYKHFDLLAVTSWEESFSLVALENMALGNPVICFENGGTPEVIGDTGIVVPEYSPLMMAESVVELYRDRNLLLTLGDLAKKRALENFTCSIQATHIYDQLVSISGRG